VGPGLLDGIAEVHRNGRTEITHVSLSSPDESGTAATGDGTKDLPPQGELISDLLNAQTQPYAPGQVVVVYADSVTAPASITAKAATLRARTPGYTSSATLNGLLDHLGVDRARLMFPGAAQRNTFAGMRQAAQKRVGRPLLNVGNAAVLHVTGSTVANAVAELRASPDVTFAEPNWAVKTSDLQPTPMPPVAAAKARQDAARRPAAARISIGSAPSRPVPAAARGTRLQRWARSSASPKTSSTTPMRY
jgi:hypothetical protein